MVVAWGCPWFSMRAQGSLGMSDGSHNRLSARVDVNMLNNDALLSATTKLGQRIDLRSKRFRQAGNRKSIRILLLN